METTPNVTPAPSPSYSNNSGGSDFFQKQISVKHILIGLGIFAVVVYVFKKNKEEIVQKTTMELRRNETKSFNGENEKVRQIRNNLHGYLKATNSFPNDDSIRAVVTQLTEV